LNQDFSARQIVPRFNWLTLVGLLLLIAGCDQHVEGPTERGKILFQRGQYNDAIIACSEALEAAPDAEAYLYRGRSYSCLGNWDRAINDFNLVIRFDPKNPEGYYQRALAFRERGEKDKADADHKIAQQLDPAYADARARAPEPPRPAIAELMKSTPPASEEPSKEKPSRSEQILKSPFPTSTGLSGRTGGVSVGDPLQQPVARDIYGQPVQIVPSPSAKSAESKTTTVEPRDSDRRRRHRDEDDDEDEPLDLLRRPTTSPLLRNPRETQLGNSYEMPPNPHPVRPRLSRAPLSDSRSSSPSVDSRLTRGVRSATSGLNGAASGGRNGGNRGAYASPPNPFAPSRMRTTGVRADPDEGPIPQPVRPSTILPESINGRFDLDE